jgi:hypothetical protein
MTDRISRSGPTSAKAASRASLARRALVALSKRMRNRFDHLATQLGREASAPLAPP